MKFVVFTLCTDTVGCDQTDCYVLNDSCFLSDGSIDDEFLCSYGNELARDNADMYGLLDDGEEDCYWATYKIVEFDSIEDAQEEYGEVGVM